MLGLITRHLSQVVVYSHVSRNPLAGLAVASDLDEAAAVLRSEAVTGFGTRHDLHRGFNVSHYSQLSVVSCGRASYQIVCPAAEFVDGFIDISVPASAGGAITGESCGDERQEGDEEEEAHGCVFVFVLSDRESWMKVAGCGGCRLEYAWRHNGSVILCQELANGQCPLHALNRSVRALCSLSMNDVDGMSVEADAERCYRIGCSIGFVRHATARTSIFRERPL